MNVTVASFSLSACCGIGAAIPFEEFIYEGLHKLVW
jgi:hypothetical protein